MVAYSFRPQFVEPILWGRKGQTIRAPRGGYSGHVTAGQKLQLYRGMRTRSCQLILRTVCTTTFEVTLRWRPVIEVLVDGHRISPKEFDAFAIDDGFADFAEMEAFWADAHPRLDCFRGTLIKWLPPSSPVEMGSEVKALSEAA